MPSRTFRTRRSSSTPSGRAAVPIWWKRRSLIPIVSAMLAAPRVSVVRGGSDYGFSYVYVIFDEGTDIYWGRSRVLEYLNKITGKLPEGVAPTLGPRRHGRRVGL